MVLEEDSQGEFRYAALESPPLMSLDRDERVVHVGCFASTLGPWMTLGYLVVPRRLIAAAMTARRLIDDHALWLEEGALAELLDSGAYARHVHRLRKIYLSRRDALIESMQQHFGGALRLGGTHAGLHLTWRIPEGFGSSAAVAAMARRCGLQAAPLPNAPIVLLGFGMPAERLIAAGVAQLAARLDTGQRALAAVGAGAD
jgi:GntR family transcriptional regulator/MocR family aminotransferase